MNPDVNLDALAQQSGAVGATSPPPPPPPPQQPPNLDALAQQSGAVNLDALAQQSGAVGATSPPTPPKPATPLSTASQMMEATNPLYAEGVGATKETSRFLGGLLKIVNDHVSGHLPDAAKQHMQNAAAWLKQQGELKGYTDPGGGVSEHMGAMGADYLGFDTIMGLMGGPSVFSAAEGGAGAGAGGGAAATLAGGTDVAQTLKQAAQTAETFNKLHPVLKTATGIGLRTVNELLPTIRAGGAGFLQSFGLSGGDVKEATGTGLLTSLIHIGAGVSLGPLVDYLARLKSEAAEAGTVKPPPVYTPQEPQPTPPEPEPITPAQRPSPPNPAPRPAPRAPAVQRFAAHEQQAARGVTAESLEDLNQYRAVDENGTPTNIQQLGLPSQSATEPYQFRVPGWSATSEAGDLLHDAGARYQQTGTRVAEGKGTGNMQPWEMQQASNFDLPRYGEEPGAVVRQMDAQGNPVPLQPPEATQPPRESSPLWLQGGTDEPPTSPFSHKEPIMRPTEYRTGVRPGSEIRQATTVGGPSILTTDPDVAAGHLTQIENIIQDPNFSKLPPARQMDILQSHNDVMQQMKEYQNLLPQHEYSPYLHQPTFAPLDVNAAMSRVGDMGDAAKEMMNGPKQMYNQWENLTKDRPGGSFRQLNDEMNDLIGKTGQVSRQRLAEVTQEMQRMFNGSDPYLGRAGTPTDLAIARNQFNNGYLVQRADDAFTNAWKGANRTGSFDVTKLQSNWKSLVNDVGAPRMSNTFGPQRFEAMNDLINDLAGEPAADQAANTAADAADRAAKAQYRTAIASAKSEDAAATKAAQDAADAKHEAALKDWQEKEDQRTPLNQARQAEYNQKKAAAAAAGKRQKWYYDVARNGWHHMATKSGMEAVASIVPKGIGGAVSAKVGAALVLKQIITHPLMAKLAYGAARAGTNPALYAPVIADIISSLHQAPPPSPDDETPLPDEQPDQQLQEQP